MEMEKEMEMEMETQIEMAMGMEILPVAAAAVAQCNLRSHAAHYSAKVCRALRSQGVATRSACTAGCGLRAPTARQTCKAT